MKMACFIDPCFKMIFLDEPGPAIVDRCVQEALKLTPAQTGAEPQSSSDPPVASEGKGLAGLLKKISSTRQKRGEEDKLQKIE